MFFNAVFFQPEKTPRDIGWTCRESETLGNSPGELDQDRSSDSGHPRPVCNSGQIRSLCGSRGKRVAQSETNNLPLSCDAVGTFSGINLNLQFVNVHCCNVERKEVLNQWDVLIVVIILGFALRWRTCMPGSMENGMASCTNSPNVTWHCRSKRRNLRMASSSPLRISGKRPKHLWRALLNQVTRFVL